MWERHPDGMQAALARHDALLRQAVEANHGTVIKTTGDGLHAVFAAASDAASAVLAGQRALLAEPWPPAALLRVRMALYTGEASLRAGDYYGPAVNRAARLMSVASGGQSLISQATAAVIQDHLPPQAGLRDLGEHRLKDLVRPERVFQIDAPDLPADFPRLKSLNAFPHNLPVQLTSFVGREHEIDEARSLLGKTHLLTLTGSGGTGKTRLSLQIAADSLPEYPHGAWLVELAPLADAAYLVPALAAVFDAREQPGRPLLDMVTDYLRAKRLLLVLDNCEHLIDACARLADGLLHDCPSLKLLASSREALGLAGETAYRVPSLALPDAHAAATPASLAQSEAARLFVERARAAQPRFTLMDANAPAVAALCRRLDGIPLALELAAARVRVLSVEQILARLDDRFRLLVGGSRTALPRQQTLRALIDWSYDLLPDDERRLLRELSVFAGGATLEAIEAVGKEDEGRTNSSSVPRSGPSSAIDVLDLLTQLVNKSLVVVEEDGPAVRYRLLETIRQYAREKLLDEKGGEAEGARNRHVAFFLQVSEAAEPRLFGAEMIAALDELEAEQDNLRAALEWALDPKHGDPLSALRLVAALWMFFWTRTSLAEGRRWVQAALAASPASPALDYQAARARALVGEAYLARNRGENPAALAAATASMALARQVGATRTLASALAVGALVQGDMGDLATARAWVEECLALSRRHGYRFELAMVAGINILLAMIANQPMPVALREEALPAARATGNPWAIGAAVLMVAEMAMASGDYANAHAGSAEAAALFQQMRSRDGRNASRSLMGHTLRRQGRHAEAAAVYAETLPVWQKLGHRAAVAYELECLAFIAVATEQWERAARLFGAAEALREQIGALMTAMERREYDRAVTQLRAGAEPALVEAAWARGRALTLEEAVAYALAEGSESSASSHSP